MAQTLCSGPPRRVGVVALQGDFREHVELLRSLGTEAFEVRGPAELAQADALVLPGGESTTISLLLESSGLLGPIRERLAAGMPALGTCAGMILLATEILDGRPDQHCFGAIDISVRRNAFGRQRDSFEAALDVAELGGPCTPSSCVRPSSNGRALRWKCWPPSLWKTAPRGQWYAVKERCS